MKQLTIGIIGNGKSTNRYQLPYILQRKEQYKVKTIFQRDLSKSDWARIDGIDYTDNLDILLNDPEVEIVVLAISSNAHYEMAKKVLAAGKHCIVEKPFTETIEQAKELYAIANEKNLIVQCYQNRRFDSDLLTVQKVIESNVLGDIQEIEMSFDYFRPERSEQSTSFSKINSFLYGHACHSLDQVISVFGKPDRVVYDVRQLLGEGRLNDYFDIDLFYGNLKVSIKSSFFRLKPRPSYVVYGKKGMFIKETKDKQEEHLKMFVWPNVVGFGVDNVKEYGTLTYIDNDKNYHEEKVVSEVGDYGRYYDALYNTIVNGVEKLVKDEETLWQLEILETGISGLK